MNEYFVPGAVPPPNSPGSSAIIRAEFTSIAAGFDKLPVLAGSAGEFVIVNETGTAMIASGFLFSDFVTVNGVQTLTNKTLAWVSNTWPGFGTGATKTAGTGHDNVLLLAENAKLPVLDGSLLTNLNPGELGVVPITNGGTGASTLAGAQAALGINLKADANNAVLTGAPTCPTPPVGNSSARIANTQFVTDTVTAIGAAIPSDATPLMNGAAAAGTHVFVSRDDHVHPVDTSRAPASAATASGTSFSPAGGIAATNVQAAISELDTEKAPRASPALTGTPTSTTPLTSDNSTRIATTAFTQSLLAQQPPGVEVSDSAPLMNGTVAPGTGVEASRYDHVHPTDTSRAPIASPSFTGTVTAPQRFNVTQSYGALQVGGSDVLRFGSDNSGQLAGFRNILINGDMRIAQRGATSFSADSLTYGGADRIYTYVPNGSGTVQQLATPVANLSGSGFYQACGPFTTTAPGVVLLGTRIESKDTTRLNGKKITISVNVYQDSGSSRNVYVQLKKARSVDNFLSSVMIAEPHFPCGHAVATRITFTQQLSATDADNGIEVNIVCLDWPTLSGKFFGIGDFQLEEGSIATPFEQRPIGLELSLCQRYYQRETGMQLYGSTVLDGDTARSLSVVLPIRMRTIPTVLTQTWSAGSPAAVNLTTGSARFNSNGVGPGSPAYLSEYALSSEL